MRPDYYIIENTLDKNEIDFITKEYEKFTRITVHSGCTPYKN